MPPATVDDLLAFLAAAPSPFHAVQQAGARLDQAGFTALDAVTAWEVVPRRGYVARDGNLVAWCVPETAAPAARLRLVGAHTDSPNLRVTPRPDTVNAGLRQLAIEVYGGALRNSWLDRDLGVSGRATVRGSDGPEQRPFLIDRPVLTVPQLAIHLDRGVSENGLVLNPHVQLRPVWGAVDGSPETFAQLLGAEVGADPVDVLGWQAMLHDVNPPALVGASGEMLASARIDNLVSCWAGVRALTAAAGRLDGAAVGAAAHVAMVALFDHEEVGSVSATGAGGAWLEQVVERLVLARGGGRADLLAALAGSRCASADGAHATHPNYLERHDVRHPVVLGGGPAVKFNANQRYATDDRTAAELLEACERAGVPAQRFVNRADLPCGSTIGPITSARLAIPTADIGVPQLAMHSAREVCGSADPDRLALALTEFLAP